MEDSNENCNGKREEVVANGPEDSRDDKPIIPYPFSVKSDGVYYALVEKKKEKLVKVCSLLYVTAYTRSKQGDNWGKFLEWRDPDGTEHKIALPSQMLAGDGAELRKALLDGGLELGGSRLSKEKILEYISVVQPKSRLTCVDQTGWHSFGTKRVYVLPDRSFGEEGILLQNASCAGHAFREKGTVCEWQTEIARYAINNPILAFAISLAFAPPLLDIVNAESGGFHFFGKSSSGKTTALIVAATVWGGGERGSYGDYIKPWRATSNGLEGIAALHCDAFLALDEVGQADSREVGEIAYMLANGSGKGRASRDGIAKKLAKWRISFLSTGEIDVVSKISETAQNRAMAGQEIRFTDIPIHGLGNYGIFSDLHGFASGDKLSNHLKNAAKKSYGVPIRKFIEKLTSLDLVTLENILENRIEKFAEMAVGENRNAQVRRVARKFGLVAASGELANEVGLLPWEVDTANRATLEIFKHWLENRGCAGAREDSRILAQARTFFELHGDGRFVSFEKSSHEEVLSRPVNNRAGYRKMEGDKLVYFALPEVFRNEICKGFNDKVAKDVLLEAGYLIVDQAKASKFSVKIRIPATNTTITAYKFSSKVLEGASDD